MYTSNTSINFAKRGANKLKRLVYQLHLAGHVTRDLLRSGSCFCDRISVSSQCAVTVRTQHDAILTRFLARIVSPNKVGELRVPSLNL